MPMTSVQNKINCSLADVIKGTGIKSLTSPIVAVFGSAPLRPLFFTGGELSE